MAPRQRFSTAAIDEHTSAAITTSTNGKRTTNRQQHRTSNNNVRNTNNITRQTREEKPSLMLESSLSSFDSVHNGSTITDIYSTKIRIPVNRVDVSIISTKSTTTLLVPTANGDASDRAREKHQIFNLIVLVRSLFLIKIF
jgi:hypothetical protein